MTILGVNSSSVAEHKADKQQIIGWIGFYHNFDSESFTCHHFKCNIDALLHDLRKKKSIRHDVSLNAQKMLYKNRMRTLWIYG